MKEQLKRAAQALEADAAVSAEPATADADGAAAAGGGQKGVAGKAQQRAKKADDYHARHREWVTEFNELTGGECVGGEGGVKWAAVRAWQQKHWQANNLLADGLVGPKTIEAAKIVAKKSGAKSEKPDAKDGAGGGDGKEAQHEAPQPGQADGAEAAADKPKMDEESEAAGDEKVEGDEKVNADSDAKLPPASGGKAQSGKRATVAEFEAKLEEIDKLLAGWKPPAGQEDLPQTALAKANGEDVKDPTKEAEAHGAMMQHASEFRAEVGQIATDWRSKLRTADKRTEALTGALNRALATEKVLPVGGATEKLSGHAAHFTPSQWQITINSNTVEKKSATPDEIQEAASGVFHEGRHAEQRFNVARLMSHQKNATPTSVAKDAGISLPAVQHAFAVEKDQPLAGDAEQEKDTESVYDDTVVHGGEHAATEKLAPKINTVGPAARALFDALSPQDQAAMKGRWEEYRARMYKVIDAYQRLPSEKDAFAAEEQLGMSKQK